MAIQAHSDQEFLSALDQIAGDCQQIFVDFDGVIIDSEPIQFDCYRQLLARYGVDFELDDFVGFISMTEDKIWEQIIEKYKLKEPKEQFIDERRTILITALTQDSIKANWFVDPIIEWAANKNAGISILSADQSSVIDAVVKHFGITSAIKKIHSLHATSTTKPELFDQLINGSAEKTLLLEDSPKNLNAARERGMKTVGVFHSLNTDAKLAADVIVHAGNKPI